MPQNAKVCSNSTQLLNNLAFAQPNRTMEREDSQAIETLYFEAGADMDGTYLMDLNGDAENYRYSL